MANTHGTPSDVVDVKSTHGGSGLFGEGVNCVKFLHQAAFDSCARNDLSHH